MGNGESSQYRSRAFILIHQYRDLKALAIERCDRGPTGAGDGDRLTLKAHLFKVGSRRDQNRISVLRQLHCLS